MENEWTPVPPDKYADNWCEMKPPYRTFRIGFIENEPVNISMKPKRGYVPVTVFDHTGKNVDTVYVKRYKGKKK